MLQKKKFTLVEKKSEKKRWINYLVILALIGFILLLILSNVKSKNYYQNLKSSQTPKEEQKTSQRSSQNAILNCTISHCAVRCSGDMTYLNQYLEDQQSCSSLELTISDYTFPTDQIESNWLKGSFKITYIHIQNGVLTRIADGSFNQESMAYVKELILENVKLEILSEKTFVGLKSLEKFTLINKGDIFRGTGFLKPMESTLKKVVIVLRSPAPLDPVPWFRGGEFSNLMTIDLSESNLGAFIEESTFSHMKGLCFHVMDYCKINYLPHGALMNQFSNIQIFQLKHLSGEYLTKLSELRKINLLNNPWDCTCNLEDLITEYWRYAHGFDLQLKCSSPKNLVGTFLTEVDLSFCDSTTAITETVHKPVKTISIECNRSTIEVSPPDTVFQISALSETTASIQFEKSTNVFGIIWFIDQQSSADSWEYINASAGSKLGCKNKLAISLIIEGLIPKRAYNFCLLREGFKNISPFNCRPYYSSKGKPEQISENDFWIKREDMALTIGLFVFGINISIGIGAIGLYLVVRLNPTLLWNSKQVTVVNQTSREVWNVMRKSNKGLSLADCSIKSSIPINTGIFERQFSEGSIKSNRTYWIAHIYEGIGHRKNTNPCNDEVYAGQMMKVPPPPKRGSLGTVSYIESFDKFDINKYYI